jgi:hypothetical protein
MPISATHPVWDVKDETITPRTLMGGQRGPVAASDHAVTFALWLTGYFITTPPGQGLPVAQVKFAALSEKVCSAKWWDDHSGKHLEKANVGGTWMCRPIQQPK